MDRRAEPVQRFEMLGHAVALVLLEAVAGTSCASAHISRSRVTLAMMEAAAIELTKPSPPITASHSQGSAIRSRPSTNTCFGASGSACTARASAHSEARKILSRSIRAGEAKATAKDAVAQIFSNRSSRSSGVSRLESSMPLGMRSGSRITAAATTGPASGPRPASSQPATGQTPRLISARSRRKLGGETAITPFGSAALSLVLSVFFFASRIMQGTVRKRQARRNRELGRENRLSPLSTNGHCKSLTCVLIRQCTRLSSPTLMLGATTTSQGWPSGSQKYPE